MTGITPTLRRVMAHSTRPAARPAAVYGPGGPTAGAGDRGITPGHRPPGGPRRAGEASQGWPAWPGPRPQAACL